MVDSDRNTHSHLTKMEPASYLTTFSNMRDKMLMVFYCWSDGLWLLWQLYGLEGILRPLSGNNAAVLRDSAGAPEEGGIVVLHVKLQ